MEIKEFKLVGIGLENKTTNENGQSNIDCGSLWQKFETENLALKIPGKLNDEIFAVYYDYEGDHTKPFSYFIGCKVKMDVRVPENMKALIISGGNYENFMAKGIMPDCVTNTWKRIWSSDVKRNYKTDFEIYDERSKDWNNAIVEIFVSVQ